MMNNFEPARKKFKVPSFILGLAFLFVSIAAFMRPGRAVIGIMWVIAAIMLLKGLFSLNGYFELRKIVGQSTWFVLVSALLDIILSVILFTNLDISMLFLGYMLAFWFIFDSFNALMLSGISRFSVFNAFLGVLGIILGLIMLFNPLIGSVFIAYMLAGYLFLFGILLIVRAF
ncbi:hypothetical protein FC70_GL001105 [Paucilactobacillus oligofermentans DSM 15707 = LMG 22743]|uniref:Integral membrane protein n=2 Tax=Paucilactobacillus oligofermentans TaxID=293371 RepID=A0A0R1RJU4_9LACO|nr:hypothetical protein FC70_GL001105 [Paucilactobacillus oligofermentans DSM 15707 = LMG 22743]